MMPNKQVARPITRAATCEHTWVSVDELADELQIPKATIYAWRARGTGPAWVRVGRHLRAKRSVVDEWLNTLVEESA